MVKNRDQIGSAPDVSAGFWEEPTIREALDDCHMGRVIRAFRLHPDHGRQPLSQETAARWAGITQAQLSRIETGAPLGHIDKLAQWAEILHIPSFYLWFRIPDHRRGDVNRGEFLRIGGLAIVGASTAAVLGGSVAALTVDDCAQWLAWELWQRRRESLHASEIPSEIRGFLHAYTARSTSQLVLRDGEGLYSFAHPSFIDFYVAQRIFHRVADGDGSLFATAQTSHETDLVIRQFVQRDNASAESLSRWMTRAPSPVLRVNSAGVLAKLGLPEFADQVVTSLKRDVDTRHLYLTAVTSRVLDMPWDRADSLAALVQAGSEQTRHGVANSEAAFYADRLTAEIHNPRDAAARWCAVVLLSRFKNAAPEKSTTALCQALHAERNAETLRSIGAVLAGNSPISY
jgi:transcriptional regulator with XRE-family HTH domain